MALGILEPGPGHQAPGTTRYFDQVDQALPTTADDASLKRDENAKVPIILIPQPSDDANDPLNWPLWRRDLVTFILCFAGILATSLGSILASNTIVLLKHFDATLSQTAVLTGYYLLGAGAGAVFFVPSARVWGKRHLFLVGICLVVASSAWAAAVGTNYRSMAAARAIQGVGSAPFESLLNAAVGDLYFVHQRGLRMAATNLAVFGGAFFTPVVVGKITESLGWQWTFNLVAIFMAITLPAVFFLCPETAYRREPRLNIDRVVDQVTLEPKADSANPPATPDDAPARRPGFVVVPTSSAMQPMGNAATPRKSFVQSLSLFDGRKTDERYWLLLLRPFPLLLHPAFIWGCLVQGTLIGWTVFIAVLIGVMFVGPPFYMGEVNTGYTYTGAFLGALGGFAISGLLADSSVKFLTRLNKGLYEPEFRILLVFPMLITGGIGLFGFGLTAEGVRDGGYSFMVPLVFFGFVVAGMVIGAVASSLYIVDAYRNLAIEGFTLMIIFKNMFSFFLTWYAYDWLVQSGYRVVLVAIACVQLGVCLLSVPLYVWGKRIRSFFHRHDILVMIGLA